MTEIPHQEISTNTEQGVVKSQREMFVLVSKPISVTILAVILILTKL
jgi:hypothetical protein